MFFLPAICLGLSVVFVLQGRHHGDSKMYGFAALLVISAFATGMIAFLAISSLK